MRHYEFPQLRGRLIEFGPELLIGVGPSQAEIELPQQSSVPQPRSIRAVIDTGARRTVITPAAAKRCGLVPVGETRVFVGGGGEIRGDVFSARIEFTGTPLSTWSAIPIVGAELLHPHIECLIGRDILRRWIMHYD